MKKHLFLFCCLCMAFVQLQAQCGAGTKEVIIQIVPDAWAYETTWSLNDFNGTVIANGNEIGDTICIPENDCVTFTIYDQFGDGIYAPGGFWVYLDGAVIGSGNAFGASMTVPLNCPAGTYCTNPIPLNYGSSTTNLDETWYVFTADTTGNFNISTCGTNSCNTSVYVYSNCPPPPYVDGPPGTYAFNDDGACGTQAVLNVALAAGTTYYIRIGDFNNDCAGAINFNLSYTGPIQGCMDVTACNYNPLAVIDDGSCAYPPNPICSGPDLKFDSLALVQSMSITTHTTSGCDVNEGCVTGYGQRYVLRFSSKIDNVGTQDYYIGNPNANPGMFNTVNCHNHTHYSGYGDYRLYDMDGNLIPAGHKNGFCVMDLCGSGQYTCGNMGISSGCYDVYGAGTQCQWLDVTDVPDGDYRMAVAVNQYNLPDALGRMEMNFANNALQICIRILRNANGVPSFSFLPGCTPYVDCAGIPGGLAQVDCNGVCNGAAKYGDVYVDQSLDETDVATYGSLIEANATTPASCNDLNGDGSLTVYDAQLANWCRAQNHTNFPGVVIANYCNFPRNITNPYDTVSLSIMGINTSAGYVDIGITSPSADIKAYQFTMSGITISGVVSLADVNDYPVSTFNINGTNQIFGLSIPDSALNRSPNMQPLVRVYYNAIIDSTVCISSITDVINHNSEQTFHQVTGGCLNVVPTALPNYVKQITIAIQPNPAKDQIKINLGNLDKKLTSLNVYDAAGRAISVPIVPGANNWYTADVSNLSQGIYYILLNDGNKIGTAKFAKN